MSESSQSSEAAKNKSPAEENDSKPSSNNGTKRVQISLEELTRKTRDLRADHVSGAVLKLVRPLSSHFQLSHSLFIPETLSEGYYTYGATYVGEILNETEANPILNGEISPSGIFSGVYINKLSKNVVGRVNAHFAHGKWMSAQLCLDRQTENSALSLALDKFNPFAMSGLCVAQFMRKINPYISLGVDIQAMRRDADNCLARCGIVGHFKARNSELLLNVANKMPYVSACLTQKVDVAPDYDLKCFVDMEVNQKEMGILDLGGAIDAQSADPASSDSKLAFSGSIGYNFRIPKNGFIFKAAAKSDGTFLSAAEYRISGLPLTFGISALLNHKMDRFSPGFKVIFGQ